MIKAQRPNKLDEDTNEAQPCRHNNNIGMQLQIDPRYHKAEIATSTVE
jgi:hypothetical protein